MAPGILFSPTILLIVAASTAESKVATHVFDVAVNEVALEQLRVTVAVVLGCPMALLMSVRRVAGSTVASTTM